MIRYLCTIVFFSGVLMTQAQYIPSDPLASHRTAKLYANLTELSKQGTLLGHQDGLAYGIGWNNLPGESDIRRVCGEYPAVLGWDLGHLELGGPDNIDSVSFAMIRKHIRDVYKRGGVNTISWHVRNPLNDKSSWDTDTVVRYILPGGSKHEKFSQWLDLVADFMLSLKDAWGRPIPVIFRPWHEHTGSWFWWGANHCTPEEYKALWRMTVEHLRRRKVHNVLYAYSTDRFDSEAMYLERYPGDDIIDILGFDVYHRNAPESNAQFIADVRKMLSILTEQATRRKKLSAITETGLERIPVQNWWTGVLYQAMQEHPPTYVLLWRNDRMDHYYAPFPGQESAEDFVKLTQMERILMERGVQKARLYRKKPS